MTIRRVILFVTFLHSCIIHSHIWQKKHNDKKRREWQQKKAAFSPQKCYRKKIAIKNATEKRFQEAAKNDTIHGNKIESVLSHEWKLKCLILRTINWKLKRFQLRARVNRVRQAKMFVRENDAERMFFCHRQYLFSLSLFLAKKMTRDWFEFLLSFPYTCCKVDKWVGIKRTVFLFFIRLYLICRQDAASFVEGKRFFLAWKLFCFHKLFVQKHQKAFSWTWSVGGLNFCLKFFSFFCFRWCLVERG